MNPVARGQSIRHLGINSFFLVTLALSCAKGNTSSLIPEEQNAPPPIVKALQPTAATISPVPQNVDPTLEFLGLEKVEEVTTSSARLSWAPHEKARHYLVIRIPADAVALTSFDAGEVVALVPHPTTSYVSTELTADTPYRYGVRVQIDTGATDANTRDVTFRTAARGAFAAPTTLDVFEGAAFTFQLQCGDALGSKPGFDLKATADAEGLCKRTEDLVACEPSVRAGHANWTMSLELVCDLNGAHMVQQAVFTVHDTNVAPQLDVLEPLTVVAESGILSLDANDAGSDKDSDGDPLSYTCAFDLVADGAVAAGADCATLPAAAGGISFNPQSGILAWAPNGAAASVSLQVYEIKITATDGTLADGRTIPVSIVPRAASLTAELAVTPLESEAGVPATLAIRVLGPDQKPLVGADPAPFLHVTGATSDTVRLFNCKPTDADGRSQCSVVAAVPQENLRVELLGGNSRSEIFRFKAPSIPAVGNSSLTVSPGVVELGQTQTLAVHILNGGGLPVLGQNPAPLLEVVGGTNPQHVSLSTCSLTDALGDATCTVSSTSAQTGLKVRFIGTTKESNAFAFTSASANVSVDASTITVAPASVEIGVLSTLSLTLRDASGAAVPGIHPLTLVEITGGTNPDGVVLSACSVSDAAGIASCKLTSATSQGGLKARFRLTSKASNTFAFTIPSVVDYTRSSLEVDPSVGEAGSQLTVALRLVNAGGYPINATSPSTMLEVVGGSDPAQTSITNCVASNASGDASCKVSSAIAQLGLRVRFIGSVRQSNSFAFTSPASIYYPSSTIAVAPITGEVGSKLLVSVHLQNVAALPISGQPLLPLIEAMGGTNLGAVTISACQSTNGSGNGTCEVSSTAVQAALKIRFKSATSNQSNAFAFTAASTVDYANSSLTVDPAVAEVGGTLPLSVHLGNAFGQPIAGASVTTLIEASGGTNLGAVSITGCTATNANGDASCLIASSVAQSSLKIRFVAAPTKTSSGFAFVPPATIDYAASTIVVAPASREIGVLATITVHLVNGGGEPIVGHGVASLIEAMGGSNLGAVSVSGCVPTDVSGNATCNVTSSVAQSGLKMRFVAATTRQSNAFAFTAASTVDFVASTLSVEPTVTEVGLTLTLNVHLANVAGTPIAGTNPSTLIEAIGGTTPAAVSFTSCSATDASGNATCQIGSTVAQSSLKVRFIGSSRESNGFAFTTPSTMSGVTSSLAVSPATNEIGVKSVLTVHLANAGGSPLVGVSVPALVEVVLGTNNAAVTINGCQPTDAAGDATCEITSSVVQSGLKVRFKTATSTQSNAFAFTAATTMDTALSSLLVDPAVTDQGSSLPLAIHLANAGGYPIVGADPSSLLQVIGGVDPAEVVISSCSVTNAAGDATCQLTSPIAQTSLKVRFGTSARTSNAFAFNSNAMTIDYPSSTLVLAGDAEVGIKTTLTVHLETSTGQAIQGLGVRTLIEATGGTNLGALSIGNCQPTDAAGDGTCDVSSSVVQSGVRIRFVAATSNSSNAVAFTAATVVDKTRSTLTVDPPVAELGEKLTLSLHLVNAGDAPIAGVDPTSILEALGGTNASLVSITGCGTSDVNGDVSCEIGSSIAQSSLRIRFTGTTRQSNAFAFTSPSTIHYPSSSLSATPASVEVGVDSVLTVHLANSAGTPIVGTSVSALIEASGGTNNGAVSIGSCQPTNASGDATCNVSSSVVQSGVRIRFKAATTNQSNALAFTAAATVDKGKSTLGVEPGAIELGQPLVLTVQLVNAGSAPIASVDPTSIMEIVGGTNTAAVTITGCTSTNSSGNAICDVRSTVAQSSLRVAFTSSATQSNAFAFTTPATVDYANSSIGVSPSSAEIGVSATVTVHLANGGNQPVVGYGVAALIEAMGGTNLGAVSITNCQPTDASGNGTCGVTSTVVQSGLRLRFKSATANQSNLFAFTAATTIDYARSTLSVDPATAEAGTNLVIAVHLENAGARPVAGVNPTTLLEATGGSNAALVSISGCTSTDAAGNATCNVTSTIAQSLVRVKFVGQATQSNSLTFTPPATIHYASSTLSISPTTAEVGVKMGLTVHLQNAAGLAISGVYPAPLIEAADGTDPTKVAITSCSSTNATGDATCDVTSTIVQSGLHVRFVSLTTRQSQAFAFTASNTVSYANSRIRVYPSSALINMPLTVAVHVENAGATPIAGKSGAQVAALIEAAGGTALGSVAITGCTATDAGGDSTCSVTSTVAQSGLIVRYAASTTNASSTFQYTSGNAAPVWTAPTILGSLTEGLGSGTPSDPKFYYVRQGNTGSVTLHVSDPDGALSALGCTNYPTAITTGATPSVNTTNGTILIGLNPDTSDTAIPNAFSCQATDDGGASAETSSYYIVVAVVSSANSSPSIALQSVSAELTNPTGLGFKTSPKAYDVTEWTSGVFHLLAQDPDADSLVGNMTCSSADLPTPPNFLSSQINEATGTIDLTLSPGHHTSATSYSFGCKACDAQACGFYFMKVTVHPASANFCDTATTQASGFSAGTGTLVDPFLICKPQELQNVGLNATNLTKYYLQKTDLDMVGFSYTPIGNNTTAFTGNYDGSRYSIKRLTYSSAATSYVGVFGKIGTGGVVKNVVVSASSFTGNQQVGALAGRNDGTVDTCTTGATIVADANTGGMVGYNAGTVRDSSSRGLITSSSNAVGGLVGYNGATIQRSFSSATVKQSGSTMDNYGGLVGHAGAGTISDSYSNGRLYGRNQVGGLVGYHVAPHTTTNTYTVASLAVAAGNIGGVTGWNNSTVTNSYQLSGNANGTAAPGTGSLASSLILQTTYGTFDFATVWTISDGAAYPRLRSSTSLGAGPAWPAASFCAGNNFVPFAGGTGSATDPYLICTIDQLDNVRDYMQAHFRLLADLDLSQATATSPFTFKPIGTEGFPYEGVFDGGNHTLSNFTYNSGENSVGLFRDNVGTIQNLKLRNFSIIGAQWVGMLSGNNYGSILNCSAQGTIKGTNSVGGLTGFDAGYVYRSYTTGLVNSQTGSAYNIGGLIGYGIGLIRESYSHATITRPTGNVTDDVGGLVGALNYAGVENSYADGDVDARNQVGGLSGRNWNSVITKSYAAGNVPASGNVGGLVGWNSGGTSSNSYRNSGAVYGSSGIGSGLTGENGFLQASHAGWDATSTWYFSDYLTRPRLRFNLDTGTAAATASNHCSTYTPVVGQFAGGTGVGTDPYLICTPTEFLLINNHPESVFRVLQNLDFTGVAYTPIGSTLFPFSGRIDGQHSVLFNIDLSSNGNDFVGTFGYNVGFIENLHVRAIRTNAGGNVGGFVGHNQGSIRGSSAEGDVRGVDHVGGFVGRNMGSIYQSYATGLVTATSSSGAYIGGFAGTNEGGVFQEVWSGAHVTQASGVTTVDNVGGLTGTDVYSSTIDSYASTDVYARNQVGLLTGRSVNSLLTRVYTQGNNNGAGNHSGLIGYNDGGNTLTSTYRNPAGDNANGGNGLGTAVDAQSIRKTTTFAAWGFGTVWSLTTDVTAPELVVMKLNGGTIRPKMNNLCMQTNPDAATFFGGGTGTIGSPYLVGTAAQFDAIRCAPDRAFRLTADINLSGYANFTPIGSLYSPFTGSLDGQGYSIKNVTISSVGSFVGVFGLAINASFSNFTIANVTASGVNRVAALVGRQTNGTIDSVYVVAGTGSVSIAGAYHIGGLVGESFGSIRHSSSTGSVYVNQSSNASGGLLGFSRAASVYTSSSTANLTKGGAVNANESGGLIGYMLFGFVQDSYARGTVTMTNQVSGLVGRAWNSVIARCYNSGGATSGNANGTIGYNDGGNTATFSYRNTNASNNGGSFGTGLTSAQMMQSANYDVSWDFTNTWQANNGTDYPTLR